MELFIKSDTLGVASSKEQIAPMNCLMLKMDDGKKLKLWLEMEIEDMHMYCVLRTNISDKKKRINIDKEMKKYTKEIKMVEWAE